VPEGIRLGALVAAWRDLGATRSRLEKRARLESLLSRLAPDEVETGVAWLSGRLPQGRIGLGWAALREAGSGSPASEAALTLREVDAAFTRLAGLSGAGSGRERQQQLRELMDRATGDEREFLSRLVIGELRQGALDGVMLEAVARAGDVPASSVRRAAMVSGDLGRVARAALAEGAAGLSRFDLELFTPLQPMLAQTAEDVGDALARLGRAGFEFKLDGARVQVHRRGDEVRVFSRQSNEVTAAVPELVEAVRALEARELILDGETLALRPDGRPRPFQLTMRRFGRRQDDPDLRRELPLSVFFFDCLRLEGETLLGRSGGERALALARAVPEPLRVPRLETADAAAAADFAEAAFARGHEGLVAKSLDAPYEAGGRGASWLKLKRAHTLDLVVLAAEWGSGRRRGFLSNLHLGARDAASGGFVMLGKTFKGLTDAMLAWQTDRLLALETARQGHVVQVRPELVVEIAFDGVQESPHYPGGLALRFARVKRHRDDKPAAQADLFETVRAIHAAQAG